MKRLLSLLALLAAANTCISSICVPAASAATLDAGESAGKGLEFFNRRQYAAAKPYFQVAVSAKPDDCSYLYYLGVSAMYSNDPSLAARAFNRALLLGSDSGTFGHLAQQGAERLHCVTKTYPLGTATNFRWQQKQMPVKVYITSGLMLPDQYGSQNFTHNSTVELQKDLKKQGFMSSLRTAPGYKPNYGEYVRRGMQAWSHAESSQFSYTVTGDPSKADIIVFWTPNMAQLGRTEIGITKKCLIQMNTDIETRHPAEQIESLMTSVATHEFGHAWGLGHSSDRKDIMYPTREASMEGEGTATPSDTDFNCMRILYDFPQR